MLPIKTSHPLSNIPIESIRNYLYIWLLQLLLLRHKLEIWSVYTEVLYPEFSDDLWPRGKKKVQRTLDQNQLEHVKNYYEFWVCLL